MTEAHTARAHARLAPSSAHRWMECPGSIAACAGIEDTATFYAAEGTAAHELCAACLTSGNDALGYLGWIVDIETAQLSSPRNQWAEPDGVRLFEVDDEMVESVQLYVDTVRSLLPKKSKEYELEVEQRLDMTHLHPEIFGTGDAVVYLPISATLHVIDFKYGKGVAVEPNDNPQLLLYGAGAARRYHNRRLEQVVLHIVQPRAPHARGPVRSWAMDALDLMDFEDRIRVAAVEAMAEDAPRHAGDWCRFCKALPVCETARLRARAVAQSEFGSDATTDPASVGPGGGCPQPPPPGALSADQMAAVLREADYLGNWVKAVQEHAHREATAGRMPTGFKLVAKRASRKWKGEQADVHAALLLEGLDDADIFTEPALKSPAQIEKVMGKKNFATIEQSMVAKVSSGTNLVPNEDARPAVKADALADFGEMA